MNTSSRPRRGARNDHRRPARPYKHSTAPAVRAPRQRGPAKQYIDPSRLIKKAVAVTAETYTNTHQFSDFDFRPVVKQNLTALGYKTPTPIQDQAMQPALDGRDVLGIANTGTGKTAAFLLPLIERVLKDYNHETALILAPTRELAQQIEAELRGFAKGLKLGSATLIGGANINPQLAQLRRNPHFVIATPGRLKDITDRKALKLESFTAVVLDEVDRMLDMGFVKEITTVLNTIPPTRQSLFFSATITNDIERLIDTFLKDPIKVRVSNGETTDSVEQNIVRVTADQSKIEVLHDLLIRDHLTRVLIFGDTKFGVERLAKELVKRGFTAASIHGNKSQSQRSRAIDAFKSGDVTILVATDVAARGIDIKDISHVINYDMPTTYADYTHRIGRTGRGGKIGHALTFVD